MQKQNYVLAKLCALYLTIGTHFMTKSLWHCPSCPLVTLLKARWWGYCVATGIWDQIHAHTHFHYLIHNVSRAPSPCSLYCVTSQDRGRSLRGGGGESATDSIHNSRVTNTCPWPYSELYYLLALHIWECSYESCNNIVCSLLMKCRAIHAEWHFTLKCNAFPLFLNVLTKVNVLYRHVRLLHLHVTHPMKWICAK